jgi:hypothetical protein
MCNGCAQGPVWSIKLIFNIKTLTSPNQRIALSLFSCIFLHLSKLSALIVCQRVFFRCCREISPLVDQNSKQIISDQHKNKLNQRIHFILIKVFYSKN